MSRTAWSRLLVPALVVALAACGGGGGSRGSSSRGKPAPDASGVGASKLVAAAPDATAAIKTAKMSGTLTLDAGGRRRTIPLDGAIDLQRRALQFSFDFGSLGLPSGGSGVAKVEARLVDGVMYMNLGALAGTGRGGDPLTAQLAGKAWVKLDLQALASSLGVDAGSGLGDISGANPTGTLDALRGVGDVQRVGSEELHGTQTTHYRVTIDPAKALDQAPAAARERLRSVLQAANGSIPADVWIDGDGRLRKMSIDLTTPQGRVSEEFELYDFGAPVDVSAPPADEVVDFGSLIGGLLNGLPSGSTASGSA